MSDGPSQIEGGRGAFSLLRDRFQSHQWAEEVGTRYNSTVEKVGIVSERQGLIPVFIDRKAINEFNDHWRRFGGREVGGWLVGQEDTVNNHPYHHITTVVPDLGSGSTGDFQFRGPIDVLNYVNQRRLHQERLVVIGTAHTHPKGWSGRITGLGRDSSAFASYDPSVVNNESWSKARTHLVLTPADNNALDVWQVKSTNEAWEKRLVRNGYFLLQSKDTPPSRVRILT